MPDFLLATPVQVVVGVVTLAILVIVGYYLVRRCRDRSDDDQLSTRELLANFREMHHEGDISEAEYRTIKTVLGEKLRQELRDTGDRA